LRVSANGTWIRYLAGRADAGRASLTLHHDAVCAKAFFRWCQKNDIVERSLLSDYEIRRVLGPAHYMPTDADMQALVRSVHDFWNPANNVRTLSSIVGVAVGVLASVLLAVFALEAQLPVLGMVVADEFIAAAVRAVQGLGKHRLILPQQTPQ